ncbi:hypothetical protein EP331_07995 [bacterium]|nr:MAG: hypothetical protein EP331_07995 [bacterium]
MAETREQRRERLKKQAQEADQNFSKQYKNELEQLNKLLTQELSTLTPNTNDYETYSKLISVVEQATSTNLTQAELVTSIKELGDVAIQIAKKIPAIAALL